MHIREQLYNFFSFHSYYSIIYSTPSWWMITCCLVTSWQTPFDGYQSFVSSSHKNLARYPISCNVHAQKKVLDYRQQLSLINRLKIYIIIIIACDEIEKERVLRVKISACSLESVKNIFSFVKFQLSFFKFHCMDGWGLIIHT